MDVDAMTWAEAALLLYLETRAVDYGGVVDMERLDLDDRARCRAWAEAGFIRFGTILASTMPAPRVDCRQPSRWAELTDASWAAAGTLRRRRAARGLALRAWVKLEDLADRTPGGGAPCPP